VRFGPLLAVLAASALATGCGADASKPDGKKVFASACGACHTLTGVESASHQGGDLLHVRANRTQLLQLTREMPVRHPLTPAELSAVTSYVLSAQRRG
jgi:mono/diheme cytochrome c family protein